MRVTERPETRATSFQTLSRLITVRDLAQPIYGRFDVSELAPKVWDAWSEDCGISGKDPMGQVALAVKAGRPVGWFGYDMLNADGQIETCAEPLLPDNMLTADTPILEAAKAFASERAHLYFILNENRIEGWLGYSELFQLPFGLCLFALLWESSSLLAISRRHRLPSVLPLYRLDELKKRSLLTSTEDCAWMGTATSIGLYYSIALLSPTK